MRLIKQLFRLLPPAFAAKTTSVTGRLANIGTPSFAIKLPVFLPIIFSLSVLSLGEEVRAPDEPPPVGFNPEIPEIAESKQMILVSVEHWNAISARVRCLERTDTKAIWKEVFPAFEAVVGKNGLAWGIGLHGTCPSEGSMKREGDGRAPAGVFSLHEAFGYSAPADAHITTFPYRHLTQTTEGVDDSNSRYYNRVVDSAALKDKDWKSSERMLRSDDRYRWGILVEHNWKQFPGFGSCIFLHIWRGFQQPTVGCTAMPAERIENIVRWLDQRSHPILVQLPTAEYSRFKDRWMLP
jgi:zinc D-Ala-D-Ala dipeptidase